MIAPAMQYCSDSLPDRGAKIGSEKSERSVGEQKKTKHKSGGAKCKSN